MKFFIPKSGDKVRVRMADGSVKFAIYDMPRTLFWSEHWLDIGGTLVIASRILSPRTSVEFEKVRFLGPTATMEQISP